MKSLRKKIAFVMVVTTLFALLTGVVLTVYLYENKVKRQSAQELNSIAAKVPSQIESISETLVDIGRVLASSKNVQEYVSQSDHDDLFRDVIDFLRDNRLDYVEITDADGTILVNLQDSLSVGRPTRNPLVRRALEGNFGHGILRVFNDTYVSATLPIRDENRYLGAITIGKRFDRKLFRNLTSIPCVHLAFWERMNRPASVSSAGNSLPPLSSLLTRTEIDILQGGGMVTRTFKVADETYQGVFFSLGEITGGGMDYIVNFRSMRYLREASQLTLVQASAVALLALTFIGQFIFWISRRVTRPLAELTRLTRRMAELDFSEKVPVHGEDEISLLGTSFNELTEALQTNIAEKDRYAAQLAELNADLEHQVSKRTEELHHSNLRLKREIAEKNDFLRAVSHDLGAPLRNIGGLVQLVEKKYAERLGESGRDKLARIRQNVQRGLAMIRQLLELSRMKTRPSRPEKIDLMKLLSQIRDDYSATLEERSIRFVVMDILPQITASPDQIRQLFQNLVDNAIKYLGDQPEPEITVGWSQEPKDYLFWVSDNGIGIPAEKRHEIFGVFRRIHHRDIHGVDGMGIGLATVKSIVEMYGGEIWVESEPGKGSTFYFTLQRSIVAPESGFAETEEAGDPNDKMETYA